MIGFHFAWNLCQGPILGISVSGTGNQQGGLLQLIPQGNPLISGDNSAPRPVWSPWCC